MVGRTGVAALVVLLMIVFSGCGADRTGADRTGADRPRTLSPAEVEAGAHVRFPPGTLLLSTSYQGFQDWRMTAMFRLERRVLADFLHASGFPEPTAGRRTVTNGDHPSSDTWKPDAATQVAGVDQTDQPVSGVYRKVMFDTGQPDVVTGFLVAFTT